MYFQALCVTAFSLAWEFLIKDYYNVAVRFEWRIAKYVRIRKDIKQLNIIYNSAVANSLFVGVCHIII